MGGKRHTPEQITAKLLEVQGFLDQGGTIAQTCKKLGISEQTFYRWRNEYGGANVQIGKQLKALEKENEQLRRAIADLTLENLRLKQEVGI
jgi:transposase-like protein